MKKKASAIYLAVSGWAAIAAVCSTESVLLWSVLAVNLALSVKAFTRNF